MAKTETDESRRGFFIRCTPESFSVLKRMATAQRVTVGNVFERVFGVIGRYNDFERFPYVLVDDGSIEQLNALMQKHERDQIWICAKLIRFATENPDLVSPYLVK